VHSLGCRNCFSETKEMAHYGLFWFPYSSPCKEVCRNARNFPQVEIYFQVQPTRCTVTQSIYSCEMPYMFQTVPSPIIRSSKLFIQLRVLCQTFTATCHCRGRVGTYHQELKTVYTAPGTLSNLYCYLPLSVPTLPRQRQVAVKV
jgi:hypothetical protein